MVCMSVTKLYIHAVWATKERYPLLNQTGRSLLIRHILYHCRAWNIQIISINGTCDHLHALIKMRGHTSVAYVIQIIKGESSWWANEIRVFEKHLQWARGYYARSVDEVSLPIVKNYINNQQVPLPYKNEIDLFLNSQSTKNL
jgi:putative transposase